MGYFKDFANMLSQSSPLQQNSIEIKISEPFAVLELIVASPSDGAHQAVPVAKNYRRLESERVFV